MKIEKIPEKIRNAREFMDLYIRYRFAMIKLQNFSIRNREEWRTSIKECFHNLTSENVDYSKRYDWIDGFTTINLKLIKKCHIPLKKRDPIIVSVVRDEMERLPFFFQYYREIGIKRFAIIDNNSCDDTINWLKKQADVDIFTCTDIFSDRRKLGWSNRVMSHYGLNRWFLLLDGDEFLDWPQRKQYSLRKMINKFEENSIFQAKALMVDMYADNTKNSPKLMFKEFKEAYMNACWFDVDTYYEKPTPEGKMMTGGIRKRVFDYEVWLTKYPLFYLRENEIVLNAHFIYPRPEYEKIPYYMVLRHYKFMLEEDIKKIRKYSKEEVFCEKSKNTKIYLRNYRKNNFSFFYEGSKKYVDSESLADIGWVERSL